MKTMIIHQHLLYTAETPIEIRALQILHDSMVIEWRWHPDLIKEDETTVKGMWPFKVETTYVTDNPWKRIKVVSEDGEPDSSYFIRLPEGMEEFISLRTRLTNYCELLKFQEEVSTANKSHWCKVHNVSEFIDVDDTDDYKITWR